MGLRHIIIAVIAATLAVAAVITPASADPVFLRTTAPLDVWLGDTASTFVAKAPAATPGKSNICAEGWG